MSEALPNSFQDKIIIFMKKNVKNFFILSIFFVIILFSYFFYQDSKIKNEIKLSENYTKASIQFNKKKKQMRLSRY